MTKNYLLFLVLLFSSTLSAQIVNIPDTNFKAKLLSASPTNQVAKNLSGNYFKIDDNNDGNIQESEALNVSSLYISGLITDFTGIQNFTSLLTLQILGSSATTINLSGLSSLTFVGVYLNNQLSDIDLTGLTNVTRLLLRDNQFTSIDLSGFGLSSLNEVQLQNNQLTSLNVTGLFNLNKLYAQENQLSNIDLTGLSNLYDLDLSNNQLTSFNLNGGHPNLYNVFLYDNLLNSFSISNLPNLNQLDASNNQLTSINFDSSLPNLQHISLHNNLFTELDISSLNDVSEFGFRNNSLLTSLNVKNGFINNHLFFEGVPNLRYICGDDNEISYIQGQLASDDYTSVTVNSYCSFTPGGTFYNIQGNNRYDEDNDGCAASDIGYPNLKTFITDGNVSGTTIANSSGSYSIPVSAGTHTLTPILENPTYFTVSPTTVSVTFPGTASPFIQNFCITPNGIHNDLEVIIIPLLRARPGFDANYKIIYKNKGNQTQSGSISLTYDDSKMDLVYSLPINNSSSNNTLIWNFSNLHPYEIREINYVMNINSSIETPAVNMGDILNYSATVTNLMDETPIDNTATLNQLVTNALDPNDKTCLEGTIVSPQLVGQYVHYTIRFENTGTANAQNVVLKDMIDTNKFDINSLIPLNSSHTFYIKINANKVEFIFENIELPFDDANNDGYVAFKLKTKPTLIVGDTFSNKADIYFDYNAPIVTNTATTTIQTLGTSDFDFGSLFTLSPVPAKNLLTITNKMNTSISSISIYNTLGQLIQVNTNPNETIDVSGLKTGSYFIKIISDKGMASSKFVKE